MAGNIDAIDSFGIAGWASTDDGARPAHIRVDVNGEPVYTFLPQDYRSDLAAAGWAGGYCSLSVRFPNALTLSTPVGVAVWNEETGQLLTKPGLLIEPPAASAIVCERAVEPEMAARLTPAEIASLCGSHTAPRPPADSWEAALANIVRLAAEQISILERDANSAHAEIARLRAALADAVPKATNKRGREGRSAVIFAASQDPLSARKV